MNEEFNEYLNDMSLDDKAMLIELMEKIIDKREINHSSCEDQ